MIERALASVTARRVAVFTVLLVTGCWALARVYDVYAREDPTVKVNWMFAMHGRRLDFAVLGSSRSYLTVDIPLVERVTQGHGLNLSLNGAEFSELALVLDRFLQRNTTRRLLLEVDPFGLDSKSFSYPFHAYFYVPYIDESLVAGHLRSYFGKRELLWEYAPLFKYAEFNTRIGWRSIPRVVREAAHDYDAWGSRLANGYLTTAASQAVHDTSYAISPSRVAAMEHILQIARAHNVQVTVFVAPEFETELLAVKNRAEIMAFYKNLAAQNGAPFLDFGNDPSLSADTTYFRDLEHLNHHGAEIFSQQLSDSLASYWTERR